ncbi:MAG TPA: acyl-CoA dehydrogenase [Acidimicrobiia bacterium]|nr:acyl-CoA dehydrogenase [Acidimicrobiia bacterium]
MAISEDHQTLAETVSAFLAKHDALGANRQLLEADSEPLPAFWGEIADLGWLGLHLPEDMGGSGFGFPELVVVVEQFGRAAAPGPAVPTLIVSATLAATGNESIRRKYLPGLADGSVVGAVGLTAELSERDGTWSGSAPAVLGAGPSHIIVLPAGDDVVVFGTASEGVELSTPPNMDPSRRAARVQLSGAAGERIDGGRRLLIDFARLLFAAEATGVAAECTEIAAAYAKVRNQFGRPIGVFQAVKHHCANMALATELAIGATWDAARAVEAGGEQLSVAAAVAASVAVPAATTNAEMNIQVHGGIGYTWADSAHLYFRRALAISAICSEVEASEEVTDLTRAGVRRTRAVDLPPEAGAIRTEVREFAQRVKALDEDARRSAMLDEGYAMPHWPKPWGRGAQAIEQLVIEEEFEAAGISRPVYPPITAYVTLTLIQQGSDEQISRWVHPMLHGELEWCQLFSEPDAGSDAAGIKTRGTKVEGGWVVNGQKVWTSSAHEADFGLATVRTDPEAPKHAGVTMMVVDMHDPGVEIRPLRQLTGSAGFNEVFLTDVFVPDDNVIGMVGGGWTVARATLGNESISVGAGTSVGLPVEQLVESLDAHPERLSGGSARIGRCIASAQANEMVNLRSIYRAVTGSGPGPEAAITKLAFTESMLEGAHALASLAGPDLAYLEDASANSSTTILGVRVWAIGGGTSEIKRNQIGERILGLPRDPLLA